MPADAPPAHPSDRHRLLVAAAIASGRGLRLRVHGAGAIEDLVGAPQGWSGPGRLLIAVDAGDGRPRDVREISLSDVADIGSIDCHDAA